MLGLHRASAVPGSPRFTLKPQGSVIVEEFERMKLEVSIDGESDDTMIRLGSPESQTWHWRSRIGFYRLVRSASESASVPV